MSKENTYRYRLFFLAGLLIICVLALLWRLIDLSIIKRAFLLQQSAVRAVRVVSIPAYRGMIVDRYGTPLGISTPVDSVWANPQMFSASNNQLKQLAKLMGIRISDINKKIKEDPDREFVYLKRELPPEVTSKIKDLSIPGLFFQREYRRYYPEGEVATHVIGFTNIDDVGQEGVELGYDKWLRGIPGKEKVLKDRLGHIIAVMSILSQPVQGHDLVLSLDDRIQFLTYRYLNEAVQKNQAEAGSAIVLNIKTGEILAMANAPSYNPNTRPLIPDSNFRNRAVTDVFEPGSTMKTFTIFNALASGKYTPDQDVNTHPGKLTIDGHTITDVEGDNGIISVTQVLQRSSNIGAAKMTLTLPPQSLPALLHVLGFGESTDSGFPGEVGGVLPQHLRWRQIDLATLSFGYGISATALQIVHAYSIIADHGVSLPITFLKREVTPPGEQILDPKICQEMMNMLESVVEPGGTATLAAVPGYRVAGKTGTAYIAQGGGYDRKHYTASFIGIAPASNPQLIVFVVLRDPQGDQHLGGQVAAPVFANIMSAALRILDVPPDDLSSLNDKKNT